MPSSRDIELKLYPLKDDSFGTAAHHHYNMGSYATTVGTGGAGGGVGGGLGLGMREPVYEDAEPQGRFARWVDSFRRDPNFSVLPKDPMDDILVAEVGSINARPPLLRDGSNHYYDMRGAALRTAQSGLARKLKGRHLQMIAIGGSIGTGLFVASGRALQLGGPASVLIAYSFIGAMLYFTVQALGELAVAFPVAGSFSAFSTRFLDPSWGFAMGWK